MGMVGSGKSYAAKIELLRSAVIYDNLQIIAVDPKQEYSHVINSIGGNIQNLDHNNQYEFSDDHICFQVRERGQEENVEKLVNLVRRIYSHTSQNQRKTLVLIDEARILMNDEEGRKVLNQFVLEGRDTNTAVTLVTQNASHFTHCREGREILDNVPGKVFMRHDRVPDSVVDYFHLSERERQELYELKTGTDSSHSEALLKITGRLDTRIRVESTDVEHAIINQGENQ
jgi:type IV secretory pathway VirB4 component